MTGARVVLVTGAGQGIGRATALAFGAAGWWVVAVDVDGAAADKTARAVVDTDGTAVAASADVADEPQVAAAVATAVTTYGRLDAAVNNAGITTPPAATHEAEAADFDRVLAVNVRGLWLCMKHELVAMLADGGGAIVNMSSMWGHVGAATSTPAYVASKHAVLGLTRTAALEYATRGIRVNAVCPGVIHTEGLQRRIDRDPDGEAALAAWAPMRRLGRPDEVADAALWLCSDAASYVTGHALGVDGGYLAR